MINAFKIPKENHVQPRIPYPAKLLNVKLKYRYFHKYKNFAFHMLFLKKILKVVPYQYKGIKQEVGIYRNQETQDPYQKRGKENAQHNGEGKS